MRPRHTQKFYESKLIPAVRVAEFYCIHGPADEMQSQTAGPHILERAPRQLCAVNLLTPIHQDDLKRFSGLAVPGRSKAAEQYFNGPVSAPGICMTNDICQCFVHPAHYSPAFRFGKSETFGELRQCAADDAERFWITA